MNITVFGAESYIGRYLINIFSINHHNVIAFVNKPGEIRLPPKNVKIMVGHNYDNGLVKNAISNSDIIINAYKPIVKFIKNKKSYINSISNKTIIEEMINLDKKRFITISRLVDNNHNLNKSFFMPVLINKFLYRSFKNEFLTTETLLKDSNLNWTIVKIIHSASCNSRGLYEFDNNKVSCYLSDYNAACFIYKIATEDLYFKESVIASNKSKFSKNKK